MLTETLSGKCPCCSYDKLLQRYGSQGYYQVDGCPKCGFGYGSNHYPESDDNKVGVEAWLDYGVHIISMHESEKYEYMFEDDSTVKRSADGKSWSITDGGRTKESKAVDYALSILNKLSVEEKRIKIFEWAEKQDRSDDVKKTVFQYTEDDVKDYLKTNPTIFREKKLQIINK